LISTRTTWATPIMPARSSGWELIAMEMKRAIVEAAISRSSVSGLGARQVEAILSETKVDRMSDIVEAKGCRLHELTNGVPALWQHNSDIPIARWTSIWRTGDRIVGRCQFPPEGTSVMSDEAY